MLAPVDAMFWKTEANRRIFNRTEIRPTTSCIKKFCNELSWKPFELLFFPGQNGVFLYNACFVV